MDAKLSRFDATLFTKNLHYAVNYWDEHADNFHDAVEQVFTSESVFQLTANAAKIAVAFVDKIGFVPAEYNRKCTAAAFAQLFDEIEQDKMFLASFTFLYFAMLFKQVDALKDFYSPENAMTYNANNDDGKPIPPELVKITAFFRIHSEEMAEHEVMVVAQKLLGTHFEAKSCVEYFFPSLLMFYLRLFDLYDGALMGFEVADFLKNIEPPKPKTDSDLTPEEVELKKMIGNKLLGSFGKKEFWQTRYTTANTEKEDWKPYDWYLNWSDISEKVLEKTGLDQRKEIVALDVGCGDSLFFDEFIGDPKLNVKHVTCIDYIDAVIFKMKDVADENNIPNCTHVVMDAVDMKLPANHFDMVFDKGTLDGILCTDTAKADVAKVLDNVCSVLKPGGFYVVVSCTLSVERLVLFQNQPWKTLLLAEYPAREDKKTKLYMIVIKKNE